MNKKEYRWTMKDISPFVFFRLLLLLLLALPLLDDVVPEGLPRGPRHLRPASSQHKLLPLHTIVTCGTTTEPESETWQAGTEKELIQCESDRK
jgi:hypothetical protein